jgi:hypothetical protein
MTEYKSPVGINGSSRVCIVSIGCMDGLFVLRRSDTTVGGHGGVGEAAAKLFEEKGSPLSEIWSNYLLTNYTVRFLDFVFSKICDN